MILYEKIPPRLYEYSISAAQKDLLVLPGLVLRIHGFKDTALSQIFEHEQWFIKVFSEDKKQISDLKKAFSRLKLPGINGASRTLRPHQWLTRWKNHWKPLSLTEELDVAPFWYKGRYKTSKKVIFLDTLMSFGTGLHETTRLMAQLIEDNRSRTGRFLDIGTGTGILTLVALKHGAQNPTAMDISPLSIEAAKSNLKANGFSARLILSDIGRLPSKQKYQTVAANLITDDLLKHHIKISNLVKPGGSLLVSGISLDNLNRFEKGFEDLSLECQKISKGKEWAAILYVKKTS